MRQNNLPIQQPQNPQKKGNPLMMKLGNIGNSSVQKQPPLELPTEKIVLNPIESQPNTQRKPSLTGPPSSQTNYNSQSQRIESHSHLPPNKHNNSANPLLNFGQTAEGHGVLFNQSRNSKIGSTELNSDEPNNVNYQYTPLSSTPLVFGNNFW